MYGPDCLELKIFLPCFWRAGVTGVNHHTLLRLKFNANLSFVLNTSYDFYYLVLKYRVIRNLWIWVFWLTPVIQHMSVRDRRIAMRTS